MIGNGEKSSFSGDSGDSESLPIAYPLVKFQTPVSMIVAGPSQSGKTTWVINLIKNRDLLFTEKIHKILFVYEIWNADYEILETQVPNIHFTNKIPSRDDIDEFAPDASVHNLIVFDDQLCNMSSCKHFSDFFLILCNNRNLSCILTVQNIYSKSSHMRDLSLNARALVLFKNMRSIDQTNLLGSQMFGNRKAFFVDAFNKATECVHSPLIVDLNPHCEKNLQLRSNILPDQLPVICYRQKT